MTLAEILAINHPTTDIPFDEDDAIALTQLQEPNVNSPKLSLTGDELFTATDKEEFGNLSDAERQLWLSWCGTSHNPHNEANEDFVKFVFSFPSATVTNLLNIRNEDVSILDFNNLGRVRLGDVQRARP